MAANCACKGIRFCKICEEYKLCNKNLQCSRSYLDDCPEKRLCENHSNGFILDGVTVLDKFITEEEEYKLLNRIEESVWIDSQSGRRKQDYGVKVNFKKQSIRFKNFTGLPNYSRYLVERLHKRMRTNGNKFKDFFPVELCNLEYVPERGSAIVPHLDDSWLWGERLVLLNLESETKMTFTLPSTSPGYNEEITSYKEWAASNLNTSQASLLPSIAVPLHRRSLLIMAGKARFTWYHAINREDITTRRLSLTMRELSDEYLPPYSAIKKYAVCPGESVNDFDEASVQSQEITESQKLGLELIKVASGYSGISVGDTLRIGAQAPNSVNAN